MLIFYTGDGYFMKLMLYLQSQVVDSLDCFLYSQWILLWSTARKFEWCEEQLEARKLRQSVRVLLVLVNWFISYYVPW